MAGKLRPFLLTKDEDGSIRITVRETRYNSQNYPLISSFLQDEKFKTAAAARTFARTNLGAEPGQFETR